MKYPQIPDFSHLSEQLTEYARLRAECGAKGIEETLAEAERDLKSAIGRLAAMPDDQDFAEREPNDLGAIHKLRGEGPRRLWTRFDEATYREKLEGAMFARFAGCVLGAIVEFWDFDAMKDWADYIGDAYPPTDYWTKTKNPRMLRYGKSPCEAYTRGGMDGVPVDDDITYTLLGLLIAEDSGVDFTTEDVGRAWLKYLPYACTAEDVALRNLKAGVSARLAGETDNPYCQWIGADIRSDPWAYLAPAYPEKAASMAYYDAYLSHRRNGIYGEMFFSAAQSAAFAVSDPVEALRIGLTEIPKECALYADVEWALDKGRDIHDYREAREAVDKRFKGTSGVHTNLNACLTIFGLMIGGTDVTRVLSQTVAMGYDNDCTTATAGSIVGAIVGKKGVPEHWYRAFHNKVYSYLIGHESFRLDDVADRFCAIAKRV